MHQTDRYREISVAGTPYEMGTQIGEAAYEEVRGFCEVSLDRVNKTCHVSRNKAEEVADESLKFASHYAPHLVEELRGVAAATDLPLQELMLLQVRNQFSSDSEGCTSLSLSSDAERLVAQNWDNDPELDQFTIVLTRHPEDLPALTTVGQAGLIAYIGFNDAGIGACLNTLPAPVKGVGVPHYFTLRRIYECRNTGAAIGMVEAADRAIPANIILSTPDGPCDLEVTIDGVFPIRDHAHVFHTNHCVHENLCPINKEFPELIQSHGRLEQLEKLAQSRDENSSMMEWVKQVLSDHDNHPYSICRHANDDPVTGYWETVMSVIVMPTEKRILVARGTPCNRDYETYKMGSA